MRILYGVQGTGHGHLIRSASMVRQLRELGHDVHCLISGRDPKTFWGVDHFAPYTALRGFTGTVRKGGVKLFESIGRLRIRRFFRDVAAFDASGFDLVVTDYEPVSGWIARRNKLPSIGLGHLYSFRGRLPLPGVTRPAQLLVGRFAGIYTPVRRAIGLHWHHFGGPNLPPTVGPEVRSADSVDDKKVLVYLPGEDEAATVALFQQCAGHQFVFYRPVEEPRQVGNVLLRPYDRQDFLADLAESGGVIANAGFTLPSEALHLGRRLLVKPIRSHPEQFLNGRALRLLRLGTVADQLSHSVLERWLGSEPPVAMNYPDVTSHLARWISGGDWDRIDRLVEQTWNDVQWRPSHDAA